MSKLGKYVVFRGSGMAFLIIFLGGVFFSQELTRLRHLYKIVGWYEKKQRVMEKKEKDLQHHIKTFMRDPYRYERYLRTTYYYHQEGEYLYSL